MDIRYREEMQGAHSLHVVVKEGYEKQLRPDVLDSGVDIWIHS